jgi:hypothetical protein
MTPLNHFLSKLPDSKPTGAGKWKALCPAHDDHQPSLSICNGDDGRVLVHCHAGCEVEAIAAAIGLTMADLMPVKGNGTKPGAQAPKADRTSTPAGSVADWRKLAEHFTATLSDEQLQGLAHDLGVTPAALSALGIGWAGRDDLRALGASGAGWAENYPGGAFAFPSEMASVVFWGSHSVPLTAARAHRRKPSRAHHAG